MKRARSSTTSSEKISSYVEIKSDKIKHDLCLNRSNLSKYDFVHQWTANNDIDDLYDLYISPNNLPLDFTLINSLLHEAHKNNTSSPEIWEKHKEHLDKTRKYTNSAIKSMKSKHIDNIDLLYNTIKEFPTTEKQFNYKKSKRKMVLYRGFAKPLYVNTGDEITTHMFMSTSVSKDTALRFMSNTNRVIWKINIAPEHFKDFPYVYFDSYIKLPHNKHTEAEFLLNVGCRMRCIKINKSQTKKVRKYTLSKNDIVSSRENISYDMYEFDFLGWDTELINTLLHKLRQ